jgi:hypothetical protein
MSTETTNSESLNFARERRVALAQRAYREYHSQCFWSYRPDLIITEDKIPFVMRGLRKYGGHRGYKIVAELCR